MRFVSQKEAYENLANAIIQSAVGDYKRALIRQRRHPECKTTSENVERLERFFYSGWYEMLTNLDPSYLIRKMKVTIDEKYGQSKRIS